MKTNKDPYYPDTYFRLDELQTYVEAKIKDIADIVSKAEEDLDKESYRYFVSELKEYINGI